MNVKQRYLNITGSSYFHSKSLLFRAASVLCEEAATRPLRGVQPLSCWDSVTKAKSEDAVLSLE